MYATNNALTLVILALFASCSATVVSPSSGRPLSSPRSSSKTANYYRYAHSLSEDYRFDPKDGWEHVNITDMKYKYASRALDTVPPGGLADDDARPDRLRSRSERSTGRSTSLLGGTVSHLINSVWDALKGVGSSENVTITWFALASHGTWMKSLMPLLQVYWS